MQLEARQLADAQRQIASELGKTAQGEAGKDAVRKLAGEQERLAERAQKLQEGLKAQSSQGSARCRGAQGVSRCEARPLRLRADVAKEIERQRLAERMRQSAGAMRAAAEEPKGGRGNTASRSSEDPRAQAATQQELARALEKAADKLASARDQETANRRSCPSSGRARRSCASS